jgi:hypothetical protein
MSRFDLTPEELKYWTESKFNVKTLIQYIIQLESIKNELSSR